MIELRVDATGVRAYFTHLEGRLRVNLVRAIAAATIDLQGYIRSNKLAGQVLKQRTGNLSRAITAFPPTDTGREISGRVAVDRTAPYGFFHEYGVPHPWVIEARNAKALRFEIGGAVVFAKRVTHPGLPERSFMRSALEDKRDAIIARIQAAVAASVRGE
jgi:hypothetical protein